MECLVGKHGTKVAPENNEPIETVKDAFETSGYSDYEIWDYTDYEGEEYDSKDSDDEDAKKLEDSERLEGTKSEEQIEIKKKVSEETLITPETESVSDESLSEDSIHPCFKFIDISESKLKLSNLFTEYPIPDDPGLKMAFAPVHVYQRGYTEDGIQKFFDMTKEMQIRPIKRMEDMLMWDTINLQYYGLDSRVIKPMCEALSSNTSVKTLNLTDSWLSEDACYHLNNLFLRNDVVDTVSLSGCRIGPKGAVKLQNGIARSEALFSLDLSGCDLGAQGFYYISNAVSENLSLKTLILNNNHLDESCADSLYNLISYSESLNRLELSWNSLNTPETWKRLLRGMDVSKALIHIDLSWNILGAECVPFLRQLLSRTTVLEILNLNGNRFYDADIPPIAGALSKNTILRELYFGNNPIKAGAQILVHAVTPKVSPNSRLQLLDMTNVSANKDIVPDLEAIENDRPWLRIVLGGIVSNHLIVGPDVKKLFLKRAAFEAMKPKKKKNQRDFGHFILTLTDNLISRDEFEDLVDDYRLKLPSSLIMALMETFGGPNSTVDLGMLKSAYLELYPDTQPPPEKPVKQKKTVADQKK